MWKCIPLILRLSYFITTVTLSHFQSIKSISAVALPCKLGYIKCIHCFVISCSYESLKLIFSILLGSTLAPSPCAMHHSIDAAKLFIPSTINTEYTYKYNYIRWSSIFIFESMKKNTFKCRKLQNFSVLPWRPNLPENKKTTRFICGDRPNGNHQPLFDE